MIITSALRSRATSIKIVKNQLQIRIQHTKMGRTSYFRVLFHLSIQLLMQTKIFKEANELFP